MLRPGFAGLFLGLLWAGATMNHGCQDLKKSFTHLNYSPIRDMRRTVAPPANCFFVEPAYFCSIFCLFEIDR